MAQPERSRVPRKKPRRVVAKPEPSQTEATSTWWPAHGPVLATHSHPAAVQTLQRLAGNTAIATTLSDQATATVTGVVQRAPSAPAPVVPEVVRTPEQVAKLTADILTVIERMEVGAGTTVVPESSYHTSSGIRASYASKMQATIPWTVSMLKSHPELRTKFGVTMAELNTAERYMAAVTALWRAVAALPAGSKLEDAKKDARVAANLTASGLDDADLQRMLTFSNWRQQVVTGLQERASQLAALQELDVTALAAYATPVELTTALAPANKRALAEWRKEKKKGKPPPAAMTDLTAAERAKLEKIIATRLVVTPLRQAGVDAGIGIDAGSAKRYVAQEMAHQDNSAISAHWGEDLAAWRRFAVQKSLPELGEKIKTAATDDAGMTLGNARIADDVAAALRNHKTWNDGDVAWAIFRAQNGDVGYANEAKAIFLQLHTTPVAPATTTTPTPTSSTPTPTSSTPAPTPAPTPTSTPHPNRPR